MSSVRRRVQIHRRWHRPWRGDSREIEPPPRETGHIFAQTGRLPVFAGGNADVDIEMLESARFALLIDHDDPDREFAYTAAAEASMAGAHELGWTVVSMKNDWITVYRTPSRRCRPDPRSASARRSARGYEAVRPVHDFPMRAIAAGADNTAELGRRLAVSKQAAGKTVAVLEERGYVTRDADPLDARRKRLEVTGLGFDVLREGETIFNELRDQWQQQIGRASLESMEEHLATLVGPFHASSDTPGWMTRDLGEPA